MNLKNSIKFLSNLLKLDLTKNLAYDRFTKLILQQVLATDSNCIDVGCYKGEVLDQILKFSPNGKHFGFEPLPFFHKKLMNYFKDKATIFPYVLSNKTGVSTFQHVKNAPAYSGLRKRKYDIKKPIIEEIKVELRTLDEVISPNLKIDLIKIDVEGAELEVLQGAKKLLTKDNPYVIFECGLGAYNYYGSKPSDIFLFLTREVGLNISLLKSFIHKKGSLDLNEFEYYFNTNKEYYFIAHPSPLK